MLTHVEALSFPPLLSIDVLIKEAGRVRSKEINYNQAKKREIIGRKIVKTLAKFTFRSIPRKMTRQICMWN